MIDPVDFNKTKLLNSTAKNFKEILLVMEDLGKLLPKRSVTNLDDFSFDLSMTSSFLPNVQNAKLEENVDLFEKKIQIFDDANFFNEYRSIIQSSSSSSLIPSDLSRVIKNINSNSTYFESIEMGKINRNDLIPSLETCLESLIDQIEKNQDILKSNNVNDFNLIKLEDNNDEFAERNAKLEQYLEEISSYLRNFKEMSKNVPNCSDSESKTMTDMNEFKSESSLEKSLENFYNLIENYKKVFFLGFIFLEE